MEDLSPKKPWNNPNHGRVIRLSQTIIDHISPQVKYPETFSDALERILKLKKLEKKKDVSKRTSAKD